MKTIFIYIINNFQKCILKFYELICCNITVSATLKDLIFLKIFIKMGVGHGVTSDRDEVFMLIALELVGVPIKGVSPLLLGHKEESWNAAENCQTSYP